MLFVLFYIRLVVGHKTDVRAGGFFAVCGSEKTDCVANDGLHLGDMISREALMSGLEVEDLSVSSFIKASSKVSC